MKLNKLIHDIPGILDVSGDSEVEITDVVYDSRKAGPGALFVAMPGMHVHGREFVEAAIRANVTAIAHDTEDTWPGVLNIRVRDAREFLGLTANRFFEDPSSKMNVIGITGTNGKTTITYLLESILAKAGKKVGVIGTVNYRFEGNIIAATNTTPLAVDLVRLMKQMVDFGIDTVIMEVSSHALDQMRVEGVQFDVACFTNLTRDHLDYHHSLEEYFKAKKLFFTKYLPDSGKSSKFASVNLDDPYGVIIKNSCSEPLITFGENQNADMQLADANVDFSGVAGRLEFRGKQVKIKSPLLGDFSVSNILAASSIAAGLEVSMENIRQGIADLKNVPGRLESVGNKDYLVLVDYAHTPEALVNVLDSLKRLSQGRIITVFGCGGDRDPGKRPIMGAAVATRSQITIVTSDNPRTEEPQGIIDQILPGIEPYKLETVRSDALRAYEGGKGLLVQPNRREAIRTAVNAAGKGDIVLIAGKGHEDYQIIGVTRHSFDDCVQAREALIERNGY